jgi:hypothetical protein
MEICIQTLKRQIINEFTGLDVVVDAVQEDEPYTQRGKIEDINP